MAVNWSWNAKKGEIVWKPKLDSDVDKNYKLVWNIYQANCIAAFIKENEKDNTYEFMSFFNDVHHMKKMLGLEKMYNGKLEDFFKEIYQNFEIDYVKLDINYPYTEKLAKYFALAGHEVRLYKGENR